jgi:hypothetical protein
MEINLDSVQRSLPYELLCKIKLSTPLTSNFQGATPLYVEFLVNGAEHSNGAIAPPNWYKDFVLPLTHLSPFKRISVNILKNGKMLINNHSKEHKSTYEITLADIMNETSRTGAIYRKTIYAEKTFIIEAEWKIVENNIFHILNREQFFSAGELSEMAFLTEGRLSQRLKEKIIMLSLALESNCNSLLREITTLMVEGQSYLNDLDLIEVLDDVNQIKGGNEFDKVLSLLKDAENADRVKKIQYPYSIFNFGTFVEIQNNRNWITRKPEGDVVQYMEELYDRKVGWYNNQPAYLPYLNRALMGQWSRDINQRINKQQYYSISLLLKDDQITFQLMNRNIIDYIGILRILSIAKYFQSGFHTKIGYYSKEILTADTSILFDNRFVRDAYISVDCDDGTIEFGFNATDDKELEAIFPLRLPFECVSPDLCLLLFYLQNNLFLVWL